ncbi:MAG: ParB/RepB/Spo0J family partition protein, partial [Candidatus Komeilibacteria bacterium]|nr:ParB/RepB/Spo0J family partition protein [Candidatus Komeilibacteria bacterium]
EDKRIQEIIIDQIEANPKQPRKDFSHDALDELIESIKHYGILQPLLVRKLAAGGYQLIAGERRLRAAKMIGLPTVPVIVKDVDDQDDLALSLIENLQRQDLNPMEEAEGLGRLMEEFNLTQEEVASKIGKKRSTVANLLRLLDLPEEIQEALRAAKITLSHAKVILQAATPAKRREVFKKIVQGDLSVQTSTRLVPTKIKVRNAELEAQEKTLESALGTRVRIVSRGEGGEIRISYFSLEELRQLLDKLGN